MDWFDINIEQEKIYKLKGIKKIFLLWIILKPIFIIFILVKLCLLWILLALLIKKYLKSFLGLIKKRWYLESLLCNLRLSKWKAKMARAKRVHNGWG